MANPYNSNPNTSSYDNELYTTNEEFDAGRADRAYEAKQKKLSTLEDSQNQFADLDNSYSDLGKGIVESNRNKIWNDLKGEEYQNLLEYATTKYGLSSNEQGGLVNPDGTDFTGKTKRLYEFGSKDFEDSNSEAVKFGIARGDISGSEKRYTPEGNYGWESGVRGVDINKKTSDVVLPENIAIMLEGLAHGRKEALEGRAVKDLIGDRRTYDSYGSGGSEYYKNREALFGKNTAEYNAEQGQSLFEKFKTKYDNRSVEQEAQEDIELEQRIKQYEFETASGLDRAVNTLKGFGSTFFSELLLNPADAVGDLTGAFDFGTAEEKTKFSENLTGYNSLFVSAAMEEVGNKWDIVTDKDASIADKTRAVGSGVLEAFLTPELLGTSLGAILAWAGPGTVLKGIGLGAKYAATANTIDKAFEAGQISKSAARVSKLRELASVEGAKSLLVKQSGYLSSALGNVNNQYEEFVENNNGKELEGTEKLAFFSGRLAIQVVNQNIDKLVDVNIIKSPAFLAAIVPAVKAASSKELGGIFRKAGEGLKVATAGLAKTTMNAGTEAVQEYSQTMMELYNSRAGSEKFKDVDTFYKFITDERNYREAGIAAIAGAGGSGQFEVLGSLTGSTRSSAKIAGSAIAKRLTKNDEPESKKTKANLEKLFTENKAKAANTETNEVTSFYSSFASNDQESVDNAKQKAEKIKTSLLDGTNPVFKVDEENVSDTESNVLKSDEEFEVNINKETKENKKFEDKINQVKALVEIAVANDPDINKEELITAVIKGMKVSLEKVEKVTQEVNKAVKEGMVFAKLKTLAEVSVEVSSGARGFLTYYSAAKSALAEGNNKEYTSNLVKLDSFYNSQNTKLSSLKEGLRTVTEAIYTEIKVLSESKGITESEATSEVYEKYTPTSKGKPSKVLTVKNSPNRSDDTDISYDEVVRKIVFPDFDAGIFTLINTVEKETQIINEVYQSVLTGLEEQGKEPEEIENNNEQEPEKGKTTQEKIKRFVQKSVKNTFDPEVRKTPENTTKVSGAYDAQGNKTKSLENTKFFTVYVGKNNEMLINRETEELVQGFVKDTKSAEDIKVALSNEIKTESAANVPTEQNGNVIVPPASSGNDNQVPSGNNNEEFSFPEENDFFMPEENQGSNNMEDFLLDQDNNEIQEEDFTFDDQNIEMQEDNFEIPQENNKKVVKPVVKDTPSKKLSDNRKRVSEITKEEDSIEADIDSLEADEKQKQLDALAEEKKALVDNEKSFVSKMFDQIKDRMSAFSTATETTKFTLYKTFDSFDGMGKEIKSNIKSLFSGFKPTGYTISEIGNDTKVIEDFKNNLESELENYDENQARFHQGLSNNPVALLLYNSRGEFNNNTVVALQSATYEYLLQEATELSNNFLSDEDIGRIFGIDEEDISDTLRSEMQEGGTTLKLAAESVGAKAYKNLGLNVENKKEKEVLISALGMTALAGVDTKYLKNVSFDSSNMKELKSSTVNLVYAGKELISSLSDIRDIAESFEVAFDVEIDKERSYSLKAPKANRKVSLHNAEYQEAPKDHQKAINKLEKTPFSFNGGNDILLELFADKDGILNEEKLVDHIMGGKVSDFSNKDSKDTYLAKRNSVLRNVMFYNEAKLAVKKGSIYFKWFVAKQHRLHLDSNRLNPQNEKELARWLVTTVNSSSAISKKDIENVFNKNKDSVDDQENFMKAQMFTYGVVQGFDGTNINDNEKIAEIDKDNAEKVFASAKILLEEKSIEELKAMALKAQHIGHASLAVANIIKYRENKETFESDMVLEVDGLTNGFAFRSMQFPLSGDPFMWLEKVGFLTEDSEMYENGSMNESRKLGKEDVYISVGKVFNGEMVKSIKDLSSNSTQAKWINLFKSKNKLPDFTSVDAIKFIRNLMKSPVMIFNYAAGLGKIANGLVDDQIRGRNYLSGRGLTDSLTEMQNGEYVITEKELVDIFGKSKGETYQRGRVALLKLNLHDKSNPDVVTLKNDMYSAISALYVQPLTDTLESLFEEQTKVNRAVTNISTLIFDHFKTEYDTWKLNTENVTKEMEIEFLKERASIIPGIAGASSDDQLNKITFLKSALENTKNEVSIKLKNGVNRKSNSVSRGFKNPGVAAAVLTILSLDSSVLAKTINDAYEKSGESALIIHDAIILGIAEANAIESYNSNFYLTNREYSITEEFVKMANAFEEEVGEVSLSRLSIETASGKVVSFSEVKDNLVNINDRVQTARKAVLGKNTKVVQMSGPDGTAAEFNIQDLVDETTLGIPKLADSILKSFDNEKIKSVFSDSEFKKILSELNDNLKGCM